ncbi:hypothetical protein PHAVU_009G072500 [Phaseolus vulgaris]|uniref:Uncharacterized protein n=1 Tax=Phaseolus vulgaris TaxID=3885 RepID=V7AVX9_PHAVU|nr:hypothetical protein PHAVU_009G072500g [Phaseolus vulgaris]ESW08763.1 hypothetical protein PHAVU_009G072500g [Phaseolus vulgaris]
MFFNLNSFRTKFVLGSSFFLGLSIPQSFIEIFHVKHQHSWHDLHVAHNSGGVDCIHFGHHTCENDAARKDSGLQWWEKFSVYNADGRNDDFL